MNFDKSTYAALKGRPRGFIEWNPQQNTLELIANVKTILNEYEKYLPMTLRQIFYRLVGLFNYEKTEKAYKRLGEHINKARRAGLIDFNAIRDDGFSELKGNYYQSPKNFIDAVRYSAKQYQLDPQSIQAKQLFVWCEASGMSNQLEQVARPYGVSVLSSGGFDSLTIKHALAVKFSQYSRVKVFHIGDHDPSGVHVFGSLAEDIEAFMVSSETQIEFERLAVIPEHIEHYNLPTAPPKVTDNRNFTGHTTQAEALPPDVLCNILEAALISEIDLVAREELLEREAEERQKLLEWTKNIHFT